MKKNLIALTAACIMLFQASGNVNAHHPANNCLQKTMQAIEKVVNSNNPGMPSGMVTARVMKDFAHRYPGIDSVNWQQGNKGATGDFINKGVNTKIYYDMNGNWSGQLKSYPVSKLDENLRKIVKQQYYDYTIQWVHEIESPASLGIPTYVFTLEGIKDYKIIRLYDGDTDILNECEKLQVEDR